jgi:hypothetical protein
MHVPDVIFCANYKSKMQVMKRKVIAPRLEVWSHFSKIIVGHLKRGKCKYCSREIKCDPNLNGTSTLRAHLKIHHHVG